MSIPASPSASPGFQPDRPDAPGFQVAEAFGFQTQTPVCALDLRVRVGFSAPAVGVLPPVTPPAVGVFAPWTVAITRTEPLDLRVRVQVDAPARFIPAPAPPPRPPTARRHRAPLHLSLHVALEQRVRHFAYLDEVVLPDDDEVLTVFAGGHR